jgi:hypothetical protein
MRCVRFRFGVWNNAFAGKRAPTPCGQRRIAIHALHRVLPTAGDHSLRISDRNADQWPAQITCRNALARERGGSGFALVSGTTPSRASALLHPAGRGRSRFIPSIVYCQPAGDHSTRISDRNADQCPAQITCRSALARECGGSVSVLSTDTTHSPASRLLRFCVCGEPGCLRGVGGGFRSAVVRRR